jgi:hypothetical protein
VFRGPNGQAGQLAATHSQSFEAFYAHVPGLKVITPSNPYDAKGLLKAAIRDNDPVVFFESEKMYGDKGMVPDGEYILPIGVADIKREGTDVTLVSFGKIMKTALAAAEEAAKEGISMEVIDLRTIRPLDIDTIIQSVKKTNRLIILEESWPVASISTEIAYRVQRNAFDYLDAPIRRLTQTDTPFAFATTLIDAALPQVAGAHSQRGLLQGITILMLRAAAFTAVHANKKFRITCRSKGIRNFFCLTWKLCLMPCFQTMGSNWALLLVFDQSNTAIVVVMDKINTHGPSRSVQCI